ncbi:MAG: EsaB/YukD family protein [Synergistaceae bacterium]|jgi:uncharacterized ubiquitin-like protein YukD|nr:EsaB/YukD family protein [Synergistaceae bacterium]
MPESKLPEAFIVTITNVAGSFAVDLEIPSELPFAEFKEKLLGILKILGESELRSGHDYRLFYKNRVLAGDETLARVGAFDGSRLVVAEA